MFWKCFILTKWYVNKVSIRSGQGVGKSFILTKWYVNKSTKKPAIDPIIKFYIN